MYEETIENVLSLDRYQVDAQAMIRGYLFRSVYISRFHHEFPFEILYKPDISPSKRAIKRGKILQPIQIYMLENNSIEATQYKYVKLPDSSTYSGGLANDYQRYGYDEQIFKDGSIYTGHHL